jgi:NTE family protein
MYSWERVLILDFFKSVYLFQWRHFTFKKAGLVDSESFRLYFQAIFEALIGELKFQHRLRQQIWYGGD